MTGWVLNRPSPELDAYTAADGKRSRHTRRSRPRPDLANATFLSLPPRAVIGHGVATLSNSAWIA